MSLDPAAGALYFTDRSEGTVMTVSVGK